MHMLKQLLVAYEYISCACFVQPMNILIYCACCCAAYTSYSLCICQYFACLPACLHRTRTSAAPH